MQPSRSCVVTFLIKRRCTAVLPAVICGLLMQLAAHAQPSAPNLSSSFVSEPSVSQTRLTTQPVKIRRDAIVPAATEAAGRTVSPARRSAFPTQDALPLRPLKKSTDAAFEHAAAGNVSVVAKALAVVLGVFFAAIWVARQTGWHRSRLTDTGVFQVIGEFPLASRKQATIVRFGKRLLVLVDTNRGFEKLTEITDQEEIEQVTAMCQTSFVGQRVGTLQDWMQHRGLQSGITSAVSGRSVA